MRQRLPANLPTVDSLDLDGVTHVTIYCWCGHPHYCYHQGQITCESLPADAPVVTLHRYFRCSLCGCRATSTMPAWNTRKGVPGGGRGGHPGYPELSIWPRWALRRSRR